MAIGKLFHLIHMTGDLPALEAWYDDVFSVRRGILDHHYMPGEKRDASLVVLGDSVIEPLAPAFRVEGWDVTPLGRFYQRFGNHWHSAAWYTDDAGELWQRFTDNGIRVYVEGGRLTDERPAASSAIMTHPKDTLMQLEFINPPANITDKDPRLKADWDPAWWLDNHPLGLHGLAYTTVLAKNLDRARTVYVDVIGGELLDEGDSSLTGTRDLYVKVGEVVVQISQPVSGGTIAAEDMAANGEIHHAAAWRIEDLEQAESYLAAKGIKTAARDDHTLISDPATTHGANFRWTTRDIG